MTNRVVVFRNFLFFTMHNMNVSLCSQDTNLYLMVDVSDVSDLSDVSDVFFHNFL